MFFVVAAPTVHPWYVALLVPLLRGRWQQTWLLLLNVLLNLSFKTETPLLPFLNAFSHVFAQLGQA